MDRLRDQSADAGLAGQRSEVKGCVLSVRESGVRLLMPWTGDCSVHYRYRLDPTKLMWL